jgi:anti-anti-sigma factor
MPVPVSPFRPVGEPDLLVDVDCAQWMLTVVGELDDVTAPRLVDAAATLDRHGELTVDRHGLAFICAAGLNAVIEIGNAQKQRHRRLRLVGMSPRTMRVFRAGGLAGLVA